MGSWAGEWVVSSSLQGHCKSPQRLWQFEKEYVAQWEGRALMHFLEQLKNEMEGE